MIEIEVAIHELEELRKKEKGLRKRIYLEDAISALRNYEELSGGK
jgi:hypothetical protein